MKKCSFCGKVKCCCNQLVGQRAQANLFQAQDVLQENFNLQIAAIAVASSGGTAKAIQTSCQANKTMQKGISTAINSQKISCDNCCGNFFQESFSNLQQNQNVEQGNFNTQSVETAIVIGGTGVARASACNDQSNTATQIGIATSRSYSIIQPQNQQPENLKQQEVRRQYNGLDTLQPVLEQSPLSSIAVNGKRIDRKIPVKGVAIKQALNNVGNLKDIPPVNSNGFHVTLNLRGKSLDLQTNQKGEILINGKKV